MSHWLFLSIAIAAEVLGTSFLKSTEGFTRLAPSVLVVVSYGISFYCLSLALKTMPVGVSYAVWSGVGIALITLIGWVFYKQTLDTPALIGIGLIVLGVIVINLFSSSIPKG